MSWRPILAATLLAVVAGSAAAQAADVLPLLQQARATGCGSTSPAGAPLRAEPALDDAARRIAAGQQPLQAVREAGFAVARVLSIQVDGARTAASLAQAVRERYCQALAQPGLTAMGLHRQGASWWVVLAVPLASPGPSEAVAARVLALTNEARASPRRCGERAFPPAPPLRLDAVLEQAALSHARDMAAHSFLEHRGSDGSEPAERVERAGYIWRSVGENVASGQQTAEQVVAEWLASPHHCENIMSARFTDMGLAFAANPRSQGGVYWAQAFGHRR